MNYPYLPEGREIQFAGLDNPFMLAAKQESERESTDHQQPTGAVVVKDGKIVGRGANKSALKSEYLMSLHRRFCFRRMLKVKSGQSYWICPGCSTSKMHAETRATLDAKTLAQGADLYLWGHWWCCKPCWDAMIKGGIENVFVYTESRNLFKR